MNIELNEKNTAYFLNKEKANHQIKNIKVLKLEDGTEINNPKQIIEKQKKDTRNETA